MWSQVLDPVWHLLELEELCAGVARAQAVLKRQEHEVYQCREDMWATNQEWMADELHHFYEKVMELEANDKSQATHVVFIDDRSRNRDYHWSETAFVFCGRLSAIATRRWVREEGRVSAIHMAFGLQHIDYTERPVGETQAAQLRTLLQQPRLTLALRMIAMQVVVAPCSVIGGVVRRQIRW